MKRIVQLCCLVGLLGLLLPIHAWAQDNFNDIGDVLYLNDTLAFVCSFDDAQTINISSSARQSAANTLNLGAFTGGVLNKAYFFGKTFKGSSSFKLANNTTELIFGEYRPNVLTGLEASHAEYLNKITLTWAGVPGASGYVILRQDQLDNKPFAWIQDSQLTTFTDNGLEVDKHYTYYVAAYGIETNNRFLSDFVNVTGKTKAFTFTATSDNEAMVNFYWEFDNHLLLSFDEQAAHFEITDNTDNTLVFEDQIVLSDLTAGALDFEKALAFKGDSIHGVMAKPSLGIINNWTLELWVNLDDSKITTRTLFDDGNIKAYIDADKRIVFQSEAGTLKSNGTVSYGTWTSLAFSWDGSNLNVYKNGGRIAMGTPSSNQTTTSHRLEAALGDQIQFGKAKSTTTANLNGLMGMLRIWNVARTINQIEDDYQDLFNTATPGLLAQWTFTTEITALPDGINGKILELSSTDPANYQVRWPTSLEFVNPFASYRHQIWLPFPHKTGDQRTYTIRMMEVGSGKRISESQATATFTHPGRPAVVISDENDSPYAIKVAISPSSKHVDAYFLKRINEQTGKVREKQLLVKNFEAGTDSVKKEIVFYDPYNEDDPEGILSGIQYRYEVTPFYSQMDKKDTLGKVSAVHQSLNFGFTATTATNAIELSWNYANFSTTGYDTLQIYRNGDILGFVRSEAGRFTDKAMLHGQEHGYELIAVKHGQRSLMQFDSAALAPNGYFKGRLIHKTKDYVIRNKPLLLRKREGNKVDTVGVYRTDDHGLIEISGIVYNTNTRFELLSISGKAMQQNTFVLSPDRPEVRNAFIKYDTSYTDLKLPGLSFNLNAQTLPNALKLEWSNVPLFQTQSVFSAIYRDNKLLNIVAATNHFIDSLGAAGQHEYKLVSYYFNTSTQKVVYVSTVASFGYPAILPASTFSAISTTTKVIDLTWQYPANAPLQAFLLSRVGEKHTFLIKHAGLDEAQPASGNLSFHYTDSLGFPGKTYTYALKGITHGEDTLVIGQVENVAYPTFTVEDVIEGLDVDKHSIQGAFADVRTDIQKQHWPSWDGLVLLNDNNKVVLPLEKSLKDNQDHHLLYDPAVGTTSGQLQVAVYKHTDEGLFISNTKSKGFNHALVAAELTFPTTPALDSYNDGLQDPVISATKDVKNHIFVSWTYPTYTTVNFKLSRKVGNGVWEDPITLSGKKRAYLDTTRINEIVQYKLHAERPNGEKTNQVWDYGYGRQYIKIEGYVFDNVNNTQAHVYVGINGKWVQTDSTGHYSLAYLELPEGQQVLEYVLPGTSEILSKAIVVSRTRDTYLQNIFLNKTNAIVPEDKNLTNVFAVIAEADTYTLTNKIRWKPSNNQYSGFKVYKEGFSELADLVNGEEMIFVDSLDNIEDARFTYVVIPYYSDRAGEARLAGVPKQKTSDFPPFNPPGHVNAFANEDQGTVELIWAHTLNNVDGYLIERNDKEVGRISFADSPVFIDSTGLPNQTYRYEIYSYLERDGRFIKSNFSILTEALYPYTGKAADVVARVGKLPDNSPENYVEIEWQYPTDVTVGGAIVYSGLDSLAAVNYPERIIIDSLGVPETHTTYSVSTFDFKEGQFYRSAPQKVNIVFPKLQKPVNFAVNNINVDTVWLNWEYKARGVDAFEVIIVNKRLSDTVVFETISNDRKNFSYLFGKGTAGVSYTYSVKAKAVRNKQAYYSEPVIMSQEYPLLPEPTFTFTSSEQNASLSWNYKTEKNSGFKLSIKKGGQVYTGSPHEGADEISYNNLPLPSIQRAYSFIPDFDDLNSNSTSFVVELTAFQDAPGAVPTTFSRTVSIQLKNDLSRYPKNVSASQDNFTSIILNWDRDVNDPLPNNYVIYRDGTRLTTLSNTALGFEDNNTSPGIMHVYRIAAKHGAEEYARTVKGQRYGDGVISVAVLSKYGTPIENDSLQIMATYGTESIIQTGITDANGYIYFRDLAYNRAGIQYTIRPLGNLTDYEQSEKKATLSMSIKQSFAGAFVYTKSRTIRGRIINPNCPNGCGRESVAVRLKLVNVNDQDNNLVEYARTRTDEQGAFSFAIPYVLDAYQKFQLVVGNEAVTEAYESTDSIGYYYLDGDNMLRQNDSTLVIDFAVAALGQALIHEVEITETIGHPLKAKVTGPGECEIFNGYEFLLRVYDQNNKFEKKVWTTNKEMNEVFPPDQYRIEIIDVNKNDAFSQAVLDYFRSRRLTIDNKHYYKQYLSTITNNLPKGDTALRDTVWRFRYNERANLTITGLSGIESACGFYTMNALQKQEVLLMVEPTQHINANTCDVTSGYILPRFSGGSVFPDTIRYNGEWELVKVAATKPNMSAPHMQLLEFYYYDASNNFQGMTTREILVEGDQSAPGHDVFIYPETAEMVPLYVLRDPPGDHSYSSIAENSKFEFQFEKKFENVLNGGSKGGRNTKENKKDMRKDSAQEPGKASEQGGRADVPANQEVDQTVELFGQVVNIQLSGDVSGGTEDKKTHKYSLNFSQSISTLGASQVSENLQGFLDGPDADVVVGVSALMSYGIVQQLYLDGCQLRTISKMTVDPDTITTTWVYTRSQIKNTIHYYESLVESVDGSYVPKDGVEFGVDQNENSTSSPQEIAERIGKGKDMFEKLLEDIDRKFTPACEMCDYAKVFLADHGSGYKNTLHSKRFIETVKGYINAVDEFCKDLREGDKCKLFNDVVKEWTEVERDKYKNAYRSYVVAKELMTFYDGTDINNDGHIGGTFFANDETVVELEDILEDVLTNGAAAGIVDKANVFQPMENITFGAGASVSKSISKENSSTNSKKVSVNMNFNFEASVEMQTETTIDTWLGMGGGTNLKTKNLVNSVTNKLPSISVSYAHKSDITSSQTNSGGFTVDYRLADDDDGDHFSTDIFYSWTDGSNTKQGPYFYIVGGRSSCPYEEGTIPRDMPKIQLLDVYDSLYPSKYYDLDPKADVVIPVALSSGNLFNESRLVMVGVPLGTNKNGLNLSIENLRVNVVYGSFSLTNPNENYYSNLVVSRGSSSNFFDYEDIELVAKPYCIQGSQGRAAFWENEAIYDTIKLEFHYRKPVSPMILNTDMGNWFVIDDKNDLDEVKEEAAVFKLSGYDVEQLRHSMKEVYVEYKKKNEEVWRRMEDFTMKQDVISVDSLLAYYRQKRNTYPEPLYPFTWDISNMNLEDGIYQIRATVVHETGSTGFSNVLEGTIDRRHPQVSGLPAPADGLLSRADEISITFDEAINADKFRFENDNPDNVTGGKLQVRILNVGGTDRVLAYHPSIPEFSAYSYANVLTRLIIVIDQDTLKKYDGREVEVVLSGMKDNLGNISNPQIISWKFKIDYFKQTPSPFKFSGPQNWVINKETKQNVLKFIVSDYDVYQVSHSINSIVLERKAGEAEWSPIDTLTISQLESNYRSRGDNSLQPVDTLYFDTQGISNEFSSVRAVLRGSGVASVASSTLSGSIDRVAPALEGLPEPSDGVYQPGDVVSFTFTEPVDRGRGYQVVSQIEVLGTLVPETLMPEMVECEGNKMIFTYDDNKLRTKLGHKLKVSVKGIHDMAGNLAENSSFIPTEFAHEFIIGNHGKATSRISILEPSNDWVVNLQNPSVMFTLGAFDLYQLEHSLDSVALEYAGGNETQWHRIATVSRQQLELYHEQQIIEGLVTNRQPVYPITWTPDVVDSHYKVRAVVKGATGFPEYSNYANGKIDRVPLFYLGVNAPLSDTIRFGTVVKLYFTEALSTESLAGAKLEIRQMINGIPGPLVDTTMYLPVADGRELEIYFDQYFAAQYDGEQVQITVTDLKDLGDNQQVNEVSELFTVRNVAEDGAVLWLRTLDFNGTRMSDGSNLLNWNNYGPEIMQYELESSTDGLAFESLTIIPSKPTEDLDYREYVNFENFMYYRLRLVNSNGRHFYSKVVAIESSGLEMPVEVQITPNPIAKDRILRFSILSEGQVDKSVVRILDLKGNVLVQQEVETGNASIHSIQLDKSILPGVYILNIIQAGSGYSIRFIVE